MRKIPGLSLTVLMTLFYASHAEAHGVVGDRVFPATLAVEDPFAADELMLPQVQYGKMKNEDGMSMKQTMIMGEYSKTITPNFALSIEGAYLNNDSADGTESGFDNIALAAGYQLIKNNAHELAVLGKLDWDITPCASFKPQFYPFGAGFRG